MQSYEERRIANEASRNAAAHHAEVWEYWEIELLEEGWGESTLPEIAELLGRTIEACRQKHYELGIAATRRYRTKQAKSNHNSAWDRGWTSLEEMGY